MTPFAQPDPAYDIINDRYRRLALLLYLGTLVLAVVSWFISRPPSAPILNEVPFLRFGVFVAIVLFLMGLDLPENGRLLGRLARRPLAVRLTLLLMAFVVAGLEQVVFLYLLISLFAYLQAGRQASMVVAAASFVMLFLRLAFGPRGNFISPGDFEQLLLYVLQTIFALWLGDIITQEAQSNDRAKTLLADLTLSHKKLEASLEQVAALAATEERNRLARDIHDGLGHYLAAINVQLEMAIKLFEQEPALAKNAAVQAKSATQAALRDVRHSVSSLRDEDRFRLRAALDQLVAQLQSESLHINGRIDGDELTCPQKILLTLYRTAQEGLTNVVKHAVATEVNLHVRLLPTQVTLTLHDNGRGFSITTIGEQKGFGLQGLRERIELVGGTIQIESGQNKGTRLNLIIPYGG